MVNIKKVFYLETNYERFQYLTSNVMYFLLQQHHLVTSIELINELPELKESYSVDRIENDVKTLFFWS